MAETSTTDQAGDDELLCTFRSWLDEAWDPDLSVGEWWDRLGRAGWAAPFLPKNAYGHGASRTASTAISNEITARGALGAPPGLGIMLAAPTIAEWGNEEQIATHVLEAVTGRQAWCQLFSEPVAGSDLAGLRTTATPDGPERFKVNGQKVWTSFGMDADKGMLLARTDPGAPKHRGITWFVIDMLQPGVDVRPLREMTGEELFCEVFLDDAVVHAADQIGPAGAGWRVANSTLMYERLGLGPTTGGQKTLARPGTRHAHLERRAGDMIGAPRAKTRRPGTPARKVMDLARVAGRTEEPTVRQGLSELHILCELGRLNAARQRDERRAGRETPGMANIGKLLASRIVRAQRDLGLRIAGAAGTLHGYEPAPRATLEGELGSPLYTWITGISLYAQAPSIYGGTDEIQRNLLAERVLGLPAEDLALRDTPFSALPPNV